MTTEDPRLELKRSHDGEAVRVIYHDEDGRQVVDLFPKEFTNRTPYTSALKFEAWLRSVWSQLAAAEQELAQLGEWAQTNINARQAADASLARVLALCDEIHGHGADLASDEIMRLRQIIERISGAVGVVNPNQAGALNPPQILDRGDGNYALRYGPADQSRQPK